MNTNETDHTDHTMETGQPSYPEGSESQLLPKGQYNLRILGSLRRIIRAVDIYSKKLATEHGITVPQLICMLKIDELGPITLKKLSSEIYLNPSTLVGIVDRLEKNQLLTRERSENDRRKVYIQLTSEGKERLKNSPPPMQEALAEAIEELPNSEKQVIAASLDKLLVLIDKSAPVDLKIKNIPPEPLL